jgi:predicted phosphoribosyltransferase
MTTDRPYRDRRTAGRVLAKDPALTRLRADAGVVVLALPRGGVPVADELASALDAPMDVFLVRKLGFPSQPELAMGAIASGGVRLFNAELLDAAGVSAEEFAEVLERETRELERREALYRRGHPALPLAGRSVVVVDDGLATGFTMRAALAALQRAGARRLAVAVPVGSRQACAEIAAEVDALVCPLQPEPFHAVGLWYDNFTPTEDEEVCACLARHTTAAAPSTRNDQ